jgi:hypothetical protein
MTTHGTALAVPGDLLQLARHPAIDESPGARELGVEPAELRHRLLTRPGPCRPPAVLALWIGLVAAHGRLTGGPARVATERAAAPEGRRNRHVLVVVEARDVAGLEPTEEVGGDVAAAGEQPVVVARRVAGDLIGARFTAKQSPTICPRPGRA